MNKALRIFYGALAVSATLAVCALAYCAIFKMLSVVPSKSAVNVDYNNIVTVLLTTVTVIFTVCALLLALLGYFGFTNLKRDAGRYAEEQALAEIAKAFGPSGNGTIRIEHEMQKEDGPHRQFLEKRIRNEVISLLPLVIDRLNRDALQMAADEPTDEGDVV